MQLKLLIFDLDGTLIDSKSDIAQAVNTTFEEFGLTPLPDELIISYVGYGVRPLLETTLKKHGMTNVDRVFEVFMDHYFERCTSKTTLFENVFETLNELNGFTKIVLTNKSNRFVPKILSALKIDPLFKAAFGRESFPKMKPDPFPIETILKEFGFLPSQAMIIGDTEADILSGQGAGITTCLASYGFGRTEVAGKLNPTFTISNFKELLQIVSTAEGVR